MEKNKPVKAKRINPKALLIGIVVLVLLVLTGFKVYVDNDYKPIHKLDYFPLEAEVTYTDTDNLLSAVPSTPSDKNIGLIFYGEERVNGECYYPLMMALAAKGYSCYLPTSFGNLPILNIEGAEFAIRKYPDIKEWYIVAHSKACEIAGYYTESHSDEVAGLIYLGGYSKKHDLSEKDLNLLSIHGSRDTVFNLDALNQAKKNDPKNSVYRVINGGNNTYFADCSLLRNDTEATIDVKQQIKETTKIIDEFLQNSEEEN